MSGRMCEVHLTFHRFLVCRYPSIAPPQVTERFFPPSDAYTFGHLFSLLHLVVSLAQLGELLLHDTVGPLQPKGRLPLCGQFGHELRLSHHFGVARFFFLVKAQGGSS